MLRLTTFADLCKFIASLESFVNNINCKRNHEMDQFEFSLHVMISLNFKEISGEIILLEKVVG